MVCFAMHWGVLHLTDEAIDAQLRALAAARRERSVGADEFRALNFGERLHLLRQDHHAPFRKLTSWVEAVGIEHVTKSRRA
ncbi:hypothetical protein GALL_258620 [mine drainage metagenome]|uniref:Uncharacterized protein n=1 Tax=mine drainage metagenome TaxID=410659 RepID=A0A1J5R8J6_9ZZZZ